MTFTSFATLDVSFQSPWPTPKSSRFSCAEPLSQALPSFFSNVNSIGTSRVTLRKRQLAGRRVLVAALGGEALGHVVRARKLLHGEQVVALERVVALAVARVDRGRVDFHVEAAAREVLRIELDVRREALEGALELGAGLSSDESQFAFARLQGPLRGGERDAAADQDQDEQLDELLMFAHGEQ